MRRLATAHPPEQSAAARAFGAEVALAPGRERGICLVVGRRSSPEALVQAAGGSLVARLGDPRKVLALLNWEALQALTRHPAVALAGGVEIDQERFAAFCALAGVPLAADEDEARTQAASDRKE